MVEGGVGGGRRRMAWCCVCVCVVVGGCVVLLARADAVLKLSRISQVRIKTIECRLHHITTFIQL